MKRILVCLLGLVALCASAAEVSIDSLWTLTIQASRDDRPRDAIALTQQIANKARQDKAYGNLLLAEFYRGSIIRRTYSGDSLQVFKKRLLLEADSARTSNLALAATIYVALGDTTRFRELNPDSLRVLIDDFIPFIHRQQGSDSFLLDNTVMSALLRHLNAKSEELDYYKTTGNTRAHFHASMELLANERNANHYKTGYSTKRTIDTRALQLPDFAQMTMSQADAQYVESLIHLIEQNPTLSDRAYAYERIASTLHSDTLQAHMLLSAIALLEVDGDTVATAGMRHTYASLSTPTFTMSLPNKVSSRRPQLLHLDCVRSVGQINLDIYRCDTAGTTLGDPVWTTSRTYIHRHPHDLLSDSLLLPLLSHDRYVLRASAVGYPQLSQSFQFVVSDLNVLVQPQVKGRPRTIVVDNLTGQRVPKARIRRFQSPKYKNTWLLQPVLGADSLCPPVSEPSKLSSTRDDSEWNIHCYTNRTIYRPGDTIHVAAILHKQVKNKLKAASGKTVGFIITDYDDEYEDTTIVRTDAYGTATAHFVLPQGAEPGDYDLTAFMGNPDDDDYYDIEARVKLSVEEYKRPTFYVETHVDTIPYAAGDTLTVKGQVMALAGYPLKECNIDVTATIEWSEQLVDTVLTTDEDGRFSFALPVKTPSQERAMWQEIWEITATAPSGEQQKTFGHINFPYTSLAELKANRAREDSVNRAEQRLQPLWIQADARSWEHDGKPVTVDIGTTLHNQLVTWQLWANDRIVREETVILDSTFISIPLTNKDSYGIGVTVLAYAMHDGKLEQQRLEIRSTHHDELKLQWDTFRNKARPGEQVEWTLHVSSPDGRPADAQMMLSVYDAALDLIDDTFYWQRPASKRQWLSRPFIRCDEYKLLRQSALSGFSPLLTPRPYFPSLNWDVTRMRATWSTLNEMRGLPTPLQSPFGQGTYNAMGVVFDENGEPFIGANVLIKGTNYGTATNVDGEFFASIDAPTEATIMYIGYEDIAFTIFPGSSVHLALQPRGDALLEQVVAYGVSNMTQGLEGRVAGVQVTEYTAAADVVRQNEAVAGVYDKASTAPSTTGTPRLRTNLRDAAYWNPRLVTDKQGNIAISFRLPDDVTTWNIYGLAHDKKGNSMQTFGTVQVQQQLMVKPHVPRFLRTGDKAVIPVNIGNLTDHAINGQSILTIIDPESRTTLHEVQASFEADSQGSATVQFALDIDSLRQAVGKPLGELTMRFVATSSEGSDGEEHSVTVMETGIKEPIVEVESRSAQQMIAAARDEIVASPGDDALSLVAQHYAHQIATPATKYPKKSASPLGKLERLQQEDGSIAWTSGMSGNRYVTTVVAEQLSRLNRHEANDDATAILTRAQAYLAAQLKERVDKVKAPYPRGTRQMMYTDFDLHQQMAVLMSGKEANRDYVFQHIIDEVKRYPDQLTIYGKAVMAQVFDLLGDSIQAHRMLESLRQYAVGNSVHGIYFDTPKAQYTWRSYQIPSVVEAIFALERLTPGDPMAMGMKRWLVEAKKTQRWSDPMTTVDALQAFQMGPRPDSVQWPVVTGYRTVPYDSLATQASGFTIKREVIADNGTDLGAHVTVRITIDADRDYDLVTVTDERPANLEPTVLSSGYSWRNGCYVRLCNEVTEYVIDRLPRGEHIFETTYYFNRPGDYTQGVASVKSAYNPAFAAYTR